MISARGWIRVVGSEWKVSNIRDYPHFRCLCLLMQFWDVDVCTHVFCDI